MCVMFLTLVFDFGSSWKFLKNVFHESTKVFKFHNFKIQVMNKEFSEVKNVTHDTQK